MAMKFLTTAGDDTLFYVVGLALNQSDRWRIV